MTFLSLKLLGTFQATAADQLLTGFRSDKVRALLIYLMVEADRPHRREILAGLLWPDFTQQAASRNLRKTLYLLRQTIDEAAPGLSDTLLNINRQTVQVNPGYSIVDLNSFKETLGNIKKHHHQHLHACQTCLKELREAAELYQGEFVTGFSLTDASTFESWLLQQRESLGQEIIIVFENLTAAYEIQGNYQQAKIFAQRQISLEPWREKAHRQLMRILVLEGRRSEALAQYENCRTILWEELGVKPAAETQLLYQKIKTGVLVAAESQTRTQLFNFPTQFSPFIGRESFLNQILDQLPKNECRLLTLVGPGGIGKTRLSIEAVHRLADKGHFKGGIYFVPLTAIDDAEHFLLALASQLKISIFGRDHIRQHLFSYLAEKELLLVLDNFEQLTSESQLLTELLQAAPGLNFLVNSREALNIRSEQRLLIEGMTTESAVTLFHQSVSKNSPGYQPAEQDHQAILEICELVGGIPLAVEIAAAWVKMMDVKTIVSHIKESVDFLQTQMPDIPERHRSMKIVFEESWRQLQPREKTALAQFSIFRNGFSLNAVIAITGVTLNEIAALLDKSLMEYPGKSRYKLHELLRQFAEEKLQEMNSDAARKALQLCFAQYYLTLVQRTETLLSGPAPQYGIAEFDMEIDNIWQAWQWAIDQDQLALISTGLEGLRVYFNLSGRFQEGASFFSTSVNQISTNENSPQRTRLKNNLLMAAASLYLGAGQFEQATKHLDEAGKLDNFDNQAKADALWGDLLKMQGKYSEAIDHIQKAIHYYESVDDRLNLIEALTNLGDAYWRSEQFETSQKTLITALNLAQEENNNWAIVSILMTLGIIYRRFGQFDTALENYDQGIQLAKEITYYPGVAIGYNTSGLIYEDMGDYKKAAECYHLSLEYGQESGTTLRWAIANGSIARVWWKLGRYEEGLSLINETTSVLRKLGYKYHQAWQLIVKAELLFSLEKYQEAWQVNQEGMALAQEMGMTERLRQGQILAVRLHVKMGQHETARLKLNEYLAADNDDFALADIHFELWKLTQDDTQAELTLTYNQRAYAQNPYVEYKERIDLLSQKLLNN